MTEKPESNTPNFLKDLLDFTHDHAEQNVDVILKSLAIMYYKFGEIHGVDEEDLSKVILTLRDLIQSSNSLNEEDTDGLNKEYWDKS